ncbi:hypothetical protein EV401DRAFT_1976026 [Pisolithus croceorrhizus]|nr:hypothetical protein EV401DRAFT_1976026 [Pisolithus croceorrhizus]
MRNRICGSTLLTQHLAGCSRTINDYLLEFTAFSQMQLQADLHRVIALMQSQPTQTQCTITTGCAILVDATGREHEMLLDQCRSFDRLLAFLPGVLHQCRPHEAWVQQWYIDRGQYDFVMDNGIDVIQLTRGSDIWSIIQPGTRIAMRIITTEVVKRVFPKYQCHCGTWDYFEVDEGAALHALEHGVTITCCHCQRRFQITITTSKERSQPSDNGSMLQAKSLIRNFLMKPIPRMEESPADNEVLQAWRSITSNPLYKFADFYKLCGEFSKKARFDGTNIVLEPEGIRHIIERFKKRTFDPGMLSMLDEPPVGDTSMQQESPDLSSSTSGTARILSTAVMTSPASMNETNGVNAFNAFGFGGFCLPSSLNQTWLQSSGQMHAQPSVNQQFVSSNQELVSSSLAVCP